MKNILNYVVEKLTEEFPEKSFFVERYIDSDRFEPIFQIVVGGKYTILQHSSVEHLMDKYNLMGTDKFKKEYIQGELIPLAIDQINAADQQKDPIRKHSV